MSTLVAKKKKKKKKKTSYDTGCQYVIIPFPDTCNVYTVHFLSLFYIYEINPGHSLFRFELCALKSLWQSATSVLIFCSTLAWWISL